MLSLSLSKKERMIKEQYILTCIKASIEAGDAILDVYNSDFAVTHKKDRSPLTLADERSHEIISKYLVGFDIPILSEEGKSVSFATRKTWDTLWIVDPLDGTKEFVKRNDEFTVNIALVEKQMPVLGVILVPVKKALYFAARGLGSYKLNIDALDLRKDLSLETIIGHSISLPAISLPDSSLSDEKAVSGEPDSEKRPYTIVGSRSHSTPELDEFVEKKRVEYGNVDFISAGSSLKICLVAEGMADIYPRLGPTMEWDTAAGQAIAENAGVNMLCHDTGKPLVYNKEDLLNPWFIVKKEK
jgi:3'(2'), 5'-bisphosphate nucleotidase